MACGGGPDLTVIDADGLLRTGQEAPGRSVLKMQLHQAGKVAHADANHERTYDNARRERKVPQAKRRLHGRTSSNQLRKALANTSWYLEELGCQLNGGRST